LGSALLSNHLRVSTRKRRDPVSIAGLPRRGQHDVWAGPGVVFGTVVLPMVRSAHYWDRSGTLDCETDGKPW
jgi:hypothetical protein